MFSWVRTLFLVALVILFFFLQQSRFLSIGGVNPNLLLIGATISVFIVPGFFYFLIWFIGSVLGVFIIAPQWFYEGFIVLGLSFIFFLSRKFLTGSHFFDFVSMLVLGTFLFYVLADILNLGNLPKIVVLFEEAAYNLILGMLLWSIFKIGRKT